jgi:alkanesulfonate monooxygenase SsuD/methylene tetrahydromethanopterin reductase-like flavin-dependent oxidoreductase (luciferase family)
VLGIYNVEEKAPFLEALTTMSAIAAQTKKIRIGHIVLNNALRNPAYLAKTLTTIDQISNGRLDVIIGAGWYPKEYEGYDLTGDGKGMPSAPERVNRLVETIQILKGMFAHEEFSYEGRYWKLKDAYNYPSPIQKPLKVNVGATKPHLIRMAAKYADGLNIRGDLEELRWSRDVYLKELERLGKSPGDFHFTGFEHTMILCKNQVEYDSVAKQQAQRWGKTVEYVKQNFFLGTHEAIAEKLAMAEGLGLEMMVIYVRPAGSVQEVKGRLSEFKDKVIPLIH